MSDATWVGCKVSQVSTSYVFGKNMSSPDQSLTDHLSWLISYFLLLHKDDRFYVMGKGARMTVSNPEVGEFSF